MTTNHDLDASFTAARVIMHRHAHTFYFASRWLRPERRRATHALYALFRTLDDLVDNAAAGSVSPAQARSELDGWRAWLTDPERHPRTEPMLPAVQATFSRYAIPPRHFLELIDGLEMDLAGRRYDDFAALTLYCYRVASTVGLAMCHVLEARDPAALARAAELGVAMQLTNILRDVREDAGIGRVYLPQDMLRVAGWSDDRVVAASAADAPFRALIKTLIERARLYYARGLLGIPYLCPDARFAILVAARCYAGILDQIEALDHDVFAARAHVPTSGKLRIAAASAVRRRSVGGPLPDLPHGAPDGDRLLGIGAAQPA